MRNRQNINYGFSKFSCQYFYSLVKLKYVKIALLAVFSLVLLSITTPSFSYAQTEPIHGELPLMQVEAVTDLIMSPGCKYVYTLTLCPSAEADQMRKIVKDKLVAGESSNQILEYFAEIYGPRVLAEPSTKGFYFVAWWFPYFLLLDFILIAAVVLIVWRKRFGTESIPEFPSESLPQPSEDIDALLEEEVRRFKEE
jgi:cytochrome c-type biogenesis protein CcmH/NrfF